MAKSKKRNLLGVIIGITAALLLCAVLFYFITEDGSFSLTGLFDSIIMGEADTNLIKSSHSTDVNIYALNDSYEFDVDFEAENVLFGFFRLYYGALGELGQNELRQLYSYTSASRVFDEFVHEYITELRKNSTVPLTYPACDIELVYEKANAGLAGLLEITVSINFSAAFDGCSSISTERDLKHFFILKQKSGVWQIDTHNDLSKSGKYFSGVFDSLIEKDGYRKSDITLTYMPGYIVKMKNLLKNSLYDLYEDENASAAPSFEEPYDRDKAVEYAMKWSDRNRQIRNLSEYKNYGDNSVNFVSQCIKAGNVPMDTLGSEQWKWYTDKLDESEKSGIERTGYSRSWINGESFYNYAVNNRHFGMAAGNAPVEEAEKGDVIQFLLPDIYGNEVVYQCLVTGAAEKENKKELMVTGNSGDIINMPFTALGYGTVRMIKIYGFNASNMS